jgi:site-specific recombinase XerD
LPKIKRTQRWEETLKEDVRSLNRGWSVAEDKGKMRLRWRYVPNQKDQSVMLPFAWAENLRKAATSRINNIYNLTLEGHDLKTAAKIADGKAPKIERDWSLCLKNFQQYKTEHENAITQKTFEHDYLKVLDDAVRLLESYKPPTNPPDLIDLCIRDWKPGSATRKRRANSLCQFLEYCVTRENAPASWLPPKDRKIHIGRKSANAKTQKKDPIADQEILTLIEDLQTTEAGSRWGNALKLLTVYGLRPVELTHLHVRQTPKGEKYLWCSYEKRSGGGITKPRRLEPLPIANTDWKLIPLLEAGLLELPKLSAEGNGVAEQIRKYLERRKAWTSLKLKVKARNEELGTYSFRHSYSVRGHKLGIDSGSMASAMGHSLEVHCREYPWATEATTQSAFDRARSSTLLNSP